jgi:GNAT superfamily N-acetyltransferase
MGSVSMTNPDAFDLRDATLADVPAIVALVQSAYRGEASRAGWTTEADLLDGQRIDAEGVSDVIARPDSLVLLAERQARILACAHVEKRGDVGYFGMFAVQPATQAQGLGRRVLAAAECLARERWSVTRMTLTVIDLRANLIAWYLRRGYRRTGEHEPFPYGDARFGIPRRDDLRFERLERELSINEEIHA